MESFFSRFRNALVLIAVLLAQTIGLAVQIHRPAIGEGEGRQVYLLRLWANAAATPIERLTHNVGFSVRDLWNNYIDLRHTRQQNADLRRQIANLRLEQASFAQDALQGHRLQAMLDFQQHYVAHTIAAQVIGTSGSDLARILTLDKGAAEGLKPDMAVITPDGVVGKLRDVFPHTAQLALLNDPSSGAGVLLESSRIRAIVRGTVTGRLQIGNLTADSRIRPGETILTSGGDLVFPRGLPVGVIESVAPDPDHQPYTSILLKPAANLAQLEEVLVITQMQAGLPAQAQQDLAQGVSTAETLTAKAQEARRAADLLAERLPSLHVNTPPDAKSSEAAALPEVNAPSGTIPRPLPALHADRFTPGSTPSAAQLIPGAPATATPLPTSPLSLDSSIAPSARKPRKPVVTEPSEPSLDAPAPPTTTTPTTEPPL